MMPPLPLSLSVWDASEGKATGTNRRGQLGLNIALLKKQSDSFKQTTFKAEEQTDAGPPEEAAAPRCL